MISGSKTPNRIVFIFILALSYIYLFLMVRPELVYHVQQPSFINDWAFFTTFTHYPGEIVVYITNFLLQFFYFNYLGSAVIIATGLLPGYLFFLISRRLDLKVTIYVCLVPLVLLLGLVSNYHFPFKISINILIVYILVFLYINLLKRKIGTFVFVFAAIPIIYYLAGSGYLVIFSATLVLINFFVVRSFKLNVMLTSLIVIYTLGFEYIAYSFLFSIAPDQAVFSLLSNETRLVFQLFDPDMSYYIFLFYLPGGLLSLFLIQRIKSFEKRKIKLQSLLFRLSFLIIFTGSSIYYIYSEYDPHTKNIHYTDYCTYKGDWLKAIEIAKSDKEYDIYVNYNYNRAIDNAGIYLESFFNYPQLIGIDVLYPDRYMTPLLTMISSDYYYDLGHIDEAQHWANEALINFPYSLRILKRLVETNIILGNYHGAEKYLNVLKMSFLADDFTNKFLPYVKDTSLVYSDTILMYKRSCIPDSLHNPTYVVNRFDDLITGNPNNRKAYEHKQLYFMLEHQLGFFADNLEESLKFYTHMPRAYQDAVLMYNSRTEDERTRKHKVSAEALRDFRAFVEIMNTIKDKESAKGLLSKYSDTYMYYVLYNSPLVTNYKLTKSFTIGY